jgi:dTDP-4-amino-4,6-dideoxygalactose transaminase
LPGINSRLDEMQAAVLRARLPYLRAWTERRRAIAAEYRTGMTSTAVRPLPQRDDGHVYHLFVVRSQQRTHLQQHLAGRGIETLIHYPVPIPAQPALAAHRPAECPVAAAACREILSLPMHPALTRAEISEVVSAVNDFQGT